MGASAAGSASMPAALVVIVPAAAPSRPRFGSAPLRSIRQKWVAPVEIERGSAPPASALASSAPSKVPANSDNCAMPPWPKLPVPMRLISHRVWSDQFPVLLVNAIRLSDTDIPST